MSNVSSSLDPNLKAPRNSFQWIHTPESVIEYTKQAIAKSRAIRDQIAALSPEECTFENVFAPIALNEAELDNTVQPLAFYQYVSADKALRDASFEAEELLNEYNIESSMRLDVFQALKTAKANTDKKTLDAEDERLIEELLRDGRRNGLDLSEETRAQVTKLKKELSTTCNKFQQNSNEEKGRIRFTREQLVGVPDDVISGYEKEVSEDGSTELYAVSFKLPDIQSIFQNAKNPETRKVARQAFDSRLEINVPLLARALELRRELAKLLGYNTWADYVEEIKMSKTGNAVVEFLDDLQNKLRPLGLRERNALLKLKKEEYEKLGYPVDNNFYDWDYAYYDNIYMEKALDLDGNLVKEYFPVDVVVPVILQIYQDLLGIRFREMTASVWHPEAQQFEVWNADPKSGADFLGDFYLDIYPREGKFGHAAMWPLLVGYTKPDGTYQHPVAGMVANLAKETPERPALMRHWDVVMVFHEMGHVFHELLSKTKYGRFHGTKLSTDFAEAPSQMLENWCWEPTILKRITRHYKTKEPMSDELISKLVASRTVNKGLFYLRQVFLGTYDILLHTDTTGEINDYSKYWCDLREKIAFAQYGDKVTHGQTGLGHLMSGYEAGYYGYLWSHVYSTDMYYTVFKADPMSPASGQKYRKEILLSGASRDGTSLLEDFLGRTPNAEAFLTSILGSHVGSS